MNPKVIKLLEDVLQAGEQIQEFVRGVSLDTYRQNILLRSAVERQFEIIGEALNRLARIDLDVFRQITDARRIVSFRNVLIHGYGVIDDEIVWEAIQHRLPQLLDEIRRLKQPEEQ